MASVGIIPARAGSKGVPNKNIVSLMGRPLLDYTLKASLSSCSLDIVIVSSECSKILRIAENCAQSAPKFQTVLRPVDLAEDETPSLPVVQHALLEIEARFEKTFDQVVLLHATSPLTLAEDIDGCITRLLETGADSVVSMCTQPELHPMKLKRIVDGRVVPFHADFEETTYRRQEMESVFKRNGAIYASKRDIVMRGDFPVGFFSGPDTRAYMMPPERSLDINTPLDLLMAEALLRKRRTSAP